MRMGLRTPQWAKTASKASDKTRRHAHDQSVGLDIFRHHRTRTHDSAFAHCNPRQQTGTRTDTGVFPNARADDPAVLIGTRDHLVVVDGRHQGTDKDILPDDAVACYVGGVHNARAIADGGVVVDRNAPTDEAVRPDAALFPNGGPIPDQGARADFNIIINHRMRPNRAAFPNDHAAVEMNGASRRARSFRLFSDIRAGEYLHLVFDVHPRLDDNLRMDAHAVSDADPFPNDSELIDADLFADAVGLHHRMRADHCISYCCYLPVFLKVFGRMRLTVLLKRKRTSLQPLLTTDSPIMSRIPGLQP
jgi:hypothetical protein